MAFNPLGAILGGVQFIAGAALTATGLGAPIGIKLMLSGGLSLISMALGGQGREGLDNDPRYGWDNVSNVATEGGPVPVIYGQERVAPQWISTNIKRSGNTQVLHLLGLISEGEIQSISDIRINDTPAEELGLTDDGDDPDIEYRLGTSGQTVIPGFNEVGTAFSVNTKLDQGDSHTHEMTQEADEVVLGLVWAGGLYKVDKNGDFIGENGEIDIRYKRYGDDDDQYQGHTNATVAGWYQPSSDKYTVGHWNTYEASGTRSQVRRVFRLQFPSRGRYVVKVTGIREDHPRRTRVPTLTQIVEVQNDQRTYANCALVGLRLPASAQLSGSMPRVTCLVKGRKVYDPRDSTTAWSRNPVLCLRDLLLNDRYGLGERITSSQIDDGSGGTWRDAADACEDTVATQEGKSEAVAELDLVLSSKAPAYEWVNQIMTSARLDLWVSDGLFRIRRQEAQSSARTFSEDEQDGNRKNILAGPGGVSTLVDESLPEPERYTRCRVRFMDRDDDYKARFVEAEDRRVPIGSVSIGMSAGERLVRYVGVQPTLVGYVTRDCANGDDYLHYAPVEDEIELESGDSLKGVQGGSTTATGASEAPSPDRPLEIQLYGVTRRSQAIREARFQLNQAQLTTRIAQWGCFLGDLDLEPGDVVTVKADRLGWTAQLFRILSIRYGMEGRGLITARQYDANVYEDVVDAVTQISTYQPGGQVTPGVRPVSSGTSSEDDGGEDAETNTNTSTQPTQTNQDLSTDQGSATANPTSTAGKATGFASWPTWKKWAFWKTFGGG